MPEQWDQNGLTVIHTPQESRGADLVEALKPFMGADLDDANGLIVVARYPGTGSGPHYQLFGPHEIVSASMVLAGALEDVAKSIRQEDVIDYLAEGVHAPDDISELDEQL